MCFYPEGTVGNVDISPGDDDGVFDGLGGNVDTEEGSISVIRHLDVEGEPLGVLKQQRHANICGHRVSSCALKNRLRTRVRTHEQKKPQTTAEDRVSADVSNVSLDVPGQDSQLTD